MNDLVIRHAPKRTQFSIPLKLSDIEIGVNGYALVSSQGKGQPKYVRMRGQQVEEVVTRSEYSSAETGAVLRDEEIDFAYKFGNDSTVPNVLERNWWESNEHAEEQRALADEALRADKEKRIKEDEMDGGDEDEEMESEVQISNAEVKRVVACTRVRAHDLLHNDSR